MKHYLFASDFDQTLSFNDSGIITDPVSVRSLFESHGLQIQGWDKVKTDWLKIGEIAPKSFAHSASQQGAGND